ncbi:MAG TPA: ribosome maturation factor RimP, partial [Thermoanaerobaculia bacterium]
FFVEWSLRSLKPDSRETKSRDARSAAKPLASELEAELAGIATAAGCELLEVEWKGGILRLILDREEPALPPAAAVAEGDGEATVEGIAGGVAGVTLGDCEHVAKQASALLDVAGFGNGRYTLEVSSPGLDRQLYRTRDYERFRGKLARITVTDPETGGKRTLVGRLDGLDGVEGVGLLDERTGLRRVISLETIKIARLEIEI